MCSKIIDKAEVKLNNEDYLVYLKEVPIRIAEGGAVEKTVVRAFVKKQ